MAQTRGCYRQFAERARTIPGVAAGSMSTVMPMGFGRFQRSVFPKEHEVTPGGCGIPVTNNVIGLRYE